MTWWQEALQTIDRMVYFNPHTHTDSSVILLWYLYSFIIHWCGICEEKALSFCQLFSIAIVIHLLTFVNIIFLKLLYCSILTSMYSLFLSVLGVLQNFYLFYLFKGTRWPSSRWLSSEKIPFTPRSTLCATPCSWVGWVIFYWTPCLCNPILDQALSPFSPSVFWTSRLFSLSRRLTKGTTTFPLYREGVAIMN